MDIYTALDMICDIDLCIDVALLAGWVDSAILRSLMVSGDTRRWPCSCHAADPALITKLLWRRAQKMSECPGSIHDAARIHNECVLRAALMNMINYGLNCLSREPRASYSIAYLLLNHGPPTSLLSCFAGLLSRVVDLWTLTLRGLVSPTCVCLCRQGSLSSFHLLIMYHIKETMPMEDTSYISLGVIYMEISWGQRPHEFHLQIRLNGSMVYTTDAILTPPLPRGQYKVQVSEHLWAEEN